MDKLYNYWTTKVKPQLRYYKLIISMKYQEYKGLYVIFYNVAYDKIFPPEDYGVKYNDEGEVINETSREKNTSSKD